MRVSGGAGPGDGRVGGKGMFKRSTGPARRTFIATRRQGHRPEEGVIDFAKEIWFGVVMRTWWCPGSPLETGAMRLSGDGGLGSGARICSNVAGSVPHAGGSGSAAILVPMVSSLLGPVEAIDGRLVRVSE